MSAARTNKRLPLEGYFLFTAADVARVAAGELTVTWRLWKRPHVKVGRAYPTGHGAVVIDDVRLVRAADVTDADARQVGPPDAKALIDLVRSHTRAKVTGDTILHRVEFHYLPEAPARPELLPKLDFKARVRKLKALGLTVSLPVGYELSELGQTYLDSLRA